MKRVTVWNVETKGHPVNFRFYDDAKRDTYVYCGDTWEDAPLVSTAAESMQARALELREKLKSVGLL